MTTVNMYGVNLLNLKQTLDQKISAVNGNVPDATGNVSIPSGSTSAPMIYGLESNLPIVPIGQYYFCTDSYKVYFGTPVGNLYLGTATVAAPPANTGGGSTATPTVVFSDDFNRADSTTSPGTSDSYAGGTNKAWVVDAGTLGTIGNQLYATTTSGTRGHIDAGVPDAKMEVTVATLGNEFDFYFRLDPTNVYHYYRYAWNPSGWNLQESASSFTTITSFAGTIAAGDVIGVEVIGTTVTLYKNGTAIHTANAITDFQTNTGFGVGFSGSIAGRIDNVKITTSSIPTGGTGDTTAPVLTVTPSTNTVFSGTQSVTMSATDTNGATIYYTTDGSDPKVSATKKTYSTALSLSATTTIRAFAQDPSGNQSATQTISYIVFAPTTSARPTNYLTATAPNGTDDTSNLQTTINSAASQGKAVIVPSGTYKINVDIGLNLPSNTTLWFDNGASFTALASSASSSTVTKIINILNATNVNIIGYPKIVGDWLIHTGLTYPAGYEYGMGIYCRSSTNVYIENIYISNCNGDGIYLGNSGSGNTYNSNVTLKNIICDNNSRNGISVISADGLTLTSPVLTNSHGTLPKCGIDFEPNLSTERLANITMTDPYIQGNGAEGIHFWMKNLGSYPISITITNMTNVINNATGSVYYGGTTATLKGFVKIDGTYYLNQ